MAFQITPQYRQHWVLYANREKIIYRNEDAIELASCSGKVLAAIPALDTFQYTISENLETITLVLGGSRIVRAFSSGELQYADFPLMYGRIVTPAFEIADNLLVFGTKIQGKVQVVFYDFHTQTRVRQSRSWSFDSIDDFVVTPTHIFLLVGRVMVLALTPSGEVEWTCMEPSLIQGKLITWKDGVLYAIHGKLKWAQKTTSFLPLSGKADQILASCRDGILLGSTHGESVAYYNLLNQNVSWYQTYDFSVQEAFVLTLQERSVLVLRAEHDLYFVDLKHGALLWQMPVSEVRDIQATQNHLLIHRSDVTILVD